MSAQNALLQGVPLLAAVASLEGWNLEDGHLKRCFEFADFPSAMAFMTRAAFDAERLCHHPNWSNVYNRVEVELWSHDLGGVSESCVALAKCMNAAAAD